MHRRARSILRGEQGLSMILVLCIGALFVALAAALVYAASLMMANADRQLPEQDVYELAVATSASPTPPVIAAAPAPLSRILKVLIIPVTVPSSPRSGAMVTMALR